MKISIRTRFNLGIVFLFIIIAVLSIFSAINLNKLSQKTAAILKENHLSVVYARDMSEVMISINQEITNSFFANNLPDSILINNALNAIYKSFQLEKNNITEPGEGKLVSDIEVGINEYQVYCAEYIKTNKSADKVIYLHKKFGILNQQLMLLSQINENAIELKTNDAKISAKNALTQMTILGTLSFLIALSFTYNFASYFNDRFSQLYNGIKEIVSSNYSQRLHFEGEDEFYYISLAFNEMAEKLHKNNQNVASTIKEEFDKDLSLSQVQELQSILEEMQSIEKQAVEIIAKFESKNIQT